MTSMISSVIFIEVFASQGSKAATVKYFFYYYFLYHYFKKEKKLYTYILQRLAEIYCNDYSLEILVNKIVTSGNPALLHSE